MELPTTNCDPPHSSDPQAPSIFMNKRARDFNGLIEQGQSTSVHPARQNAKYIRDAIISVSGPLHWPQPVVGTVWPTNGISGHRWQTARITPKP